MTNLSKILTICSVMHNESERIPGFILAAQFLSSNIVVVVQESSDNSSDLLRGLGITVINDECHGHPERSFHLLLEHIKTPWAAIVDADESIEADSAALSDLLTSTSKHAFALQRKTSISACDYIPTKIIELEDDFHLRIFRPSEVILPSSIHTRITTRDGSLPERVPETIAILRHEKTIFEQIKDDLNYMKVMDGQWISRCQQELNDSLLAAADTYSASSYADFRTLTWKNDSSIPLEGVELCRIDTSFLRRIHDFSPLVGSIQLKGYERDALILARYPIFSFKNYTHCSFVELFRRYAVENHWHLFVEPGSVAIDIGAHVGDTSLVLAALVGSAGACLAFEPNPELIGPLRTTATMNYGSLEIYPICAAVSDHHLGVSTFADHGNNNINGGLDLSQASMTSDWTKSLFSNITGQIRYDVPTVRLKSFTESFFQHCPVLKDKPISFVKIDVEGFESYILDSNSDFFEIHQPVLFLDWFQYHGNEDTVLLFDLIARIGYTPLDPISLSTVSCDSGWIPDLLCIPPRHGKWSNFLQAFNSSPNISLIKSKVERAKQILLD